MSIYVEDFSKPIAPKDEHYHSYKNTRDGITKYIDKLNSYLKNSVDPENDEEDDLRHFLAEIHDLVTSSQSDIEEAADALHEWQIYIKELIDYADEWENVAIAYIEKYEPERLAFKALKQE